MYISRLHLCGYKNTYEKSEVTLNRGLNVLLGENGCGKTAIINALRMLFREVDSRYSFSSDDFYCSTDKNSVSSEIEISAVNCTQDYGQQEKWRPRLVDRLKSKDVP